MLIGRLPKMRMMPDLARVGEVSYLDTLPKNITPYTYLLLRIVLIFR